MKRMTLALLFLFTVALASFAVADADDMKITGTVVSSSGSTLVVRTDAGQEMTLFVDTSSKDATGLSAGQRVTVNYDMDGGRNHVSSVDVTAGTTGTTATGTMNETRTGTTNSYDNTNTGTTGTSNYNDKTGTTTTTAPGSTYSSRYNTRDRNMPATASPLALLALGGLAALGSGSAIRGLLKR